MNTKKQPLPIRGNGCSAALLFCGLPASFVWGFVPAFQNLLISSSPARFEGSIFVILSL